MEKGTRHLCFSLTEEQHRELRAYARKRHRSLASVVRGLIDQVLVEERARKLKALENLLARELPVEDWEETEKKLHGKSEGCI